MVQTLGARASNVPLPTGWVIRKNPGAGAGAAFPAAENYLNAAGSDGQIGPFQRTDRFWLHAGASIIIDPTAPSGYARCDYQLRLLVNGAYGNDINGINYFLKTSAFEAAAHPNRWSGIGIEAMFRCEPYTDYHVRLLSKNTAQASYWTGAPHYAFWGYTVGEGLY